MRLKNQLIYDRFATDTPLHAASMTLDRMRSIGEELHTHDFYEFMYVSNGRGNHVLPGEVRRLSAGDLVFIRPPDAHTIHVAAGERMEYINVAFPVALWHEYCRFVDIDPNSLNQRSTQSIAPTSRVPERLMSACSDVFLRALDDFYEGPTRVNLCSFLSQAVQCFAEKQPITGLAPDTPEWLINACRMMQLPENFGAGVPRFADLSGVSLAHLSRSLQKATGLSASEFVLALKLQRAATLLQSTNAEIADIALDCGFENLSYFYRCFRFKFGATPRSYRLGSRR